MLKFKGNMMAKKTVTESGITQFKMG